MNESVLSLHRVGEDSSHSLQQQLGTHLSQTVQQHLQLLPVLHEHGLVFALTNTSTTPAAKYNRVASTVMRRVGNRFRVARY